MEVKLFGFKSVEAAFVCSMSERDNLIIQMQSSKKDCQLDKNFIILKGSLKRVLMRLWHIGWAELSWLLEYGDKNVAPGWTGLTEVQYSM